MANGRRVIDARVGSKGNITHVRIEGNQRFTGLDAAMRMADRGELSNAHRVNREGAKPRLRTNPNGRTSDNLDDMAGD